MKTIFAAAALLMLSACSTATDDRVKAIQNLTVACNSISATVNTLTAFKRAGDLSVGQIALVSEMAPVAVTLCDPANPPVDTLSALTKAQAILAQLAAVAANPAR